jgi:hypothetical protein
LDNECGNDKTVMPWGSGRMAVVGFRVVSEIWIEIKGKMWNLVVEGSEVFVFEQRGKCLSGIEITVEESEDFGACSSYPCGCK